MDASPRLVALAVVLAVAIAPARAAHAAARRSLVLEVTGAPGDWRAEALARTLSADLADDRLAPRTAPACGGPCTDQALRAAGVEIAVRATLTAGAPTLGYELRALWPGAPPPVRGAIALGGLERAAFAGALRDQLHRLARATSEDSTAPDVSAPSAAGSAGAAVRAGADDLPPPGDLARLIGLALAILAAPIALGSLRARRLVARAAALRTLAGVACTGAVALAIWALAPANSHGVVLAAGGLAWGALIAVTVPVVFPPLVGMNLGDHHELTRLIAGWGGLVARRAILVALVYAPVALGIAATGDAILASSGTVQLAVVLSLWIPLGLLVVRQALRLAVAVAAERLDAALVDATADAAAWHGAVRGYFTGYLRRNGLPIDDDLLDRLIVLPAAGDEVRVYGGGATHTRLAIPRRMLELALAPWGRPHDYAAPRISTLHWTQWNAGLVMATEQGSAVATREQRQPRETTTEGDPSETAREHIGEPPTLIGIIEPTALDPRTSYRPHDDPAWLDWDPGDEYDGTDAGDRDFLFGVVAHAVAQIQRHADRIDTLAALLARGGRFLAPLGRLVERASDAVADDHTAISGARHHLVQYLGWEAWQREDLLTARAYAPELEAMSRRVIAEQSQPASRATPTAARARLRLARLAGLVRGAAPARNRWRRVALAGALVAGAGAAALAIADAVRYHTVYTDRSKTSGAPPENPRHGQD